MFLSLYFLCFMLLEHIFKISQMEIHFILSLSGHSSVTMELLQQLCCVRLKGHNACSEFFSIITYIGLLSSIIHGYAHPSCLGMYAALR